MDWSAAGCKSGHNVCCDGKRKSGSCEEGARGFVVVSLGSRASTINALARFPESQSTTLNSSLSCNSRGTAVPPIFIPGACQNHCFPQSSLPQSTNWHSRSRLVWDDTPSPTRNNFRHAFASMRRRSSSLDLFNGLSVFHCCLSQSIFFHKLLHPSVSTI